MIFRSIMIFAVLFVTATLYGCGGTPLTYADSKEEKPGPGLLSGEDGVITVIRKERADTE